MPKKVLTGKIVSAKMQKTVVVEVESNFRHPLYDKNVVKSKRYMAHTNDTLVVDSKVKIIESAPYSKNVKWEVLEVLEK